jgi:hypothetical protein
MIARPSPANLHRVAKFVEAIARQQTRNGDSRKQRFLSRRKVNV